MTAFGAVFYQVVVRRVVAIGWQNQLVATLAASILLVNLAIVSAGSLPKFVYSPLVSEVVNVAGMTFSLQRVLIIACALASFAGLYVLLRYTKPGKAMRALAQNREAAIVVGIPVHRIGLVAVMTGAGLAGVAAATIPVLSNVQPTMGLIVTLKAFAAVVMGGFGNVTGAIVSAFVIGVVEALGVGYISSAYGDAFVFGILILVLLIRPHGVFGRAIRVS
jgi:branched-chain amino acid transport system permease protein